MFGPQAFKGITCADHRLAKGDRFDRLDLKPRSTEHGVEHAFDGVVEILDPFDDAEEKGVRLQQQTSP